MPKTRRIRLPIVEAELSHTCIPLTGEVSFALHHSTICKALEIYLSENIFQYPVKVNQMRMETDNATQDILKKRRFFIHVEATPENGENMKSVKDPGMGEMEEMEDHNYDIDDPVDIPF